MKMKTILTGLVVCSFAAAQAAQAAQPALPDALRKEVDAAVAKGLSWLAVSQKPEGHWSDERFPAMTALPLWAFAGAGGTQYTTQMDKAVAFILSKAQPDGGIYVPDPQRGGAGLGNYNTSICMMALHATGRRDVAPALLKAREYTAATQLIGDDEHAGGFGYDRGGRRHTDLTNTGITLDAMRRTQDVEDLRPAGQRRTDLNWDAALKYVANMQLKEGDETGGFLYTQSFRPGANAEAPAADAKPQLRSYGSITYVGLLSLLHAQLTRSDPRVVSALDYCTKHWNLDENPGQGRQGLYFYYNILTRALSAAGVDAIPQASGGTLAWREALIRQVLDLQRPDGSWVNDNNRWWENDPVLVTSYSLLALEFASGMTR